MIKVVRKIILSAISVLGVSLLIWVAILLNPTVAYSYKTQFDVVTVYHNQLLEVNTANVIKDAVSIIKKSTLFKPDISIELCFNDGSFYPRIHPLIGQSLAYAILDKTILNDCKPIFNKNIARTQWSANNHEARKFNLTWLLAHEFSHNLQFNTNSSYVMSSTLGRINWKLEGHAEYTSRQFKNDGQLKEKIERYVTEENKEHIGFPVFELEDGTAQILPYFKYALVFQYLVEQEKLNYLQICDDNRTLDKIYNTMIEWSQK